MPTAEAKKKIIKDHGKNAKDVGGTEVQVGIVTERINEITEHLQRHKKDLHSERGLVLLVGKRRKLLDYLASRDEKVYQDLIKKAEDS